MLTNRQAMVLVIAVVESFVISAHYAVFMPFYPNVARSKGNSPTEVGVFFAASSFVGLVGAPIVGWLLKNGVRPKTMIVFGLLLSGALLSAHGMYNDVFSTSRNFFYANIITRIVHAIGPLAATTAIYPIVAVEMGEQRATYIPMIEAAYNIGLMLWPTIGAMMFDHFGYKFPFVSVGLCAVVMGLVIAVVLPLTDKPAEDTANKIGFRSIDSRLMLILLNIGLCYLIIGFNDITLSVELRNDFRLSHTQIGYCFAVSTVAYVVCIYLWSYAFASENGRCISQAICYLVATIGLFLMGPCKFVGLAPSLVVRLCGQAAMGAGLAGLFSVSLVAGMLHFSRDDERGLADDVATHGFVSGLVFFALCSGYLVGHACFAGVLLDLVGYNSTVMCITAAIAVIASLDLLDRTVRACCSRRSEYEDADVESDRREV